MCGMVGGVAGWGSCLDVDGAEVRQRVGCREVELLIWATAPLEGVAPVLVGGVEAEWVPLGPVQGSLYGRGVKSCQTVGRRLPQCLKVGGL